MEQISPEAFIKVGIAWGKRLRKYRESLGMAFRELACRAGISENALYRIEMGQRTGNLRTWEQIAQGFGLKIEELLRELRGLEEE